MRKRFYTNVVWGVLYLSSLYIVQCAHLSDVKSLKLGHAMNANHPIHKGMEYMAQRVSEKSFGKLQIEIYPSQLLGSERQCLELLQMDKLAMTKVSAAVYENIAPQSEVMSLPRGYNDRGHAYNEHALVPDVLMIATLTWNSLTSHEQKWLEESAGEAVDYQLELSQATEGDALTEVVQTEVEIIRLDNELFAERTENPLITY